MKTLNKFFTILLVLLVFSFTTAISAQNGNGANTGGPANQVPGTGQGAGGPGNSYGPGNGAGQGLGPKHKGDKIPLDGGLSILLLGAAAFGVKKLRDNKKQ
tara:strand:+ start:3573 stop:3875 length:303 start_codon:yes stop_codon:yes gene_type:complete